MQNITLSKAFVNYLKYRKPISKPYYQLDSIPAVYVWRTRGDGKVRISHHENNGKVFTRDNPPATGHPGQGHNCRCVPEPYVRGVTKYVNQTVISDTTESPKKWTDRKFMKHFWFGGGRTVTLAETGHLKGIINYYFYHLGTMEKTNNQIIQAALIPLKRGYFEYSFNKSYVFGGIRKYRRDREQYLYCFGGRQ